MDDPRRAAEAPALSVRTGGTRGRSLAVALLAVALASARAASGQDPPAGAEPTPPEPRAERLEVAPDLEEPSRTETPVPVDPVPLAQPPQPEYPLDLSVAFRLADAENPEIALARNEILSALAFQQQARALLLPTLNVGTNYHAHQGNLQRSSGRILSLSEQSLYVGGGARTLAAESLGIPAVNITSPITEAWFEPLAARQRLTRAQFGARAAANATLLEVAVLYLDLLAAQANLEALRLSESQTSDIARVTASFSRVGEGRQADADRAEVQRQLRRAEVQEAEGEVAIASARLARRLNLDPSTKLTARSGPVEPISLIRPDSDLAGLLGYAIQRRPELTALTAEVAEARVMLKEEIYRPLLPTVWVGFSGGAFGGGSNLSPPSNLARFAGRTDFDVRLIWTVLNFGGGNLARQKQRRAQIGQVSAERAAQVNLVRREVASALATSGARFKQIDQARRQLGVAEAGFAEDLNRTRQNLGRPLEVLDNLDLLVKGRLALIRAITEYNQAQLRLFVALGSPPPPPPPPTEPVPPPPITTPLRGPILSTGAASGH